MFDISQFTRSNRAFLEYYRDSGKFMMASNCNLFAQNGTIQDFKFKSASVTCDINNKIVAFLCVFSVQTHTAVVSPVSAAGHGWMCSSMTDGVDI